MAGRRYGRVTRFATARDGLHGRSAHLLGGTSISSAWETRWSRRARRMHCRRWMHGGVLSHRRLAELVPHSPLDDLILLIHQGLQGWVAEDGAAGSMAQRQYVQNYIQRGALDTWETEHWRAAAAGRIRISGSRADSNGLWRLALTEMVGRGCRQQQLGKEHCKAGREAFWARARDLRLTSKVFHAMLRTTL